MKLKRKFITSTERFFLYENGELNEDEKKELETNFICNSDLKLEYKIYLEVNDFLKRNHEKLKKTF